MNSGTVDLGAGINIVLAYKKVDISARWLLTFFFDSGILIPDAHTVMSDLGLLISPSLVQLTTT